MNKTYASALDYILQSAAEKKKGKTGGISTEELDVKNHSTAYLTSTAEKSSIKGRVDKHLKDNFGVDDHEIAEMYNELENEGYIRNIKDKETIKITLKGLDWISAEIGGFSQERINKISDRELKKMFDGFLAFGTIGLVVVEILIHYPEIVHNFFRLFCGR